jgi:hypothetical protein
MTPPVPSFEDYLASLTWLTPHVDPTVETEESTIIRAAAESGDLAFRLRTSLRLLSQLRDSTQRDLS